MEPMVFVMLYLRNYKLNLVLKRTALTYHWHYKFNCDAII